jgi:hypothetical protein
MEGRESADEAAKGEEEMRSKVLKTLAEKNL